MYLTRPEPAKKVASDFFFILKMRKNPQDFGSQNDRDRPD